MSQYAGLDLSPSHADLLAASAISPEVAEARGYRTVQPAELKALGFARGQIRGTALLVPRWDVHGEMRGCQIRQDDPRTARGRLLRYETPAGQANILDVPPAVRPHLGDPRRPLLITEGARKADAAVTRGALCLSIAGVYGWRGRTETGGTAALACWETIALKGEADPRMVLLAFDSDVISKSAVRIALDRLWRYLTSRGARVGALVLPPGPEGAKAGLDDWLAAHPDATAADLEALAVWTVADVPGADDATQPRGGDRPCIIATDPELEARTRRVWRAIDLANRRDPRLFLRGGPVRLERDEHGQPVLRPLTADRLLLEAAAAAVFTEPGKRDGDPDVQVAAPRDTGNLLLASATMPLPPLSRITETPSVRPDGSVHTAAGYDAITRVYHAPPAGLVLPDIPERPSAADVADARTLLLDDLLGDFPFAGEADRAHAVALLLLPFVRDAIDGPTPLHGVEASVPGSGKGLLVDATLGVAYGRTLAKTPPAGDNDEWRKRLTAALLAGSGAIIFDNLTRLDSGSLADALTADVWSDRILGRSDTVSIPVRAIFASTANNPVLTSDFVRRYVRIRLVPRLERPEERTGFRHPDLLGWARQQRGALIGAALTLIRHWYASGAHQWDVRLGSYEAWSATIGGILDSAGITGFLANRRDLYAAADAESAAWRTLCQRWAEEYGDRPTTAAELFEIARGWTG